MIRLFQDSDLHTLFIAFTYLIKKEDEGTLGFLLSNQGVNNSWHKGETGFTVYEGKDEDNQKSHLWFDIQKGDNILCSTFTRKSVVDGIIKQGGVPVFLDSDSQFSGISQRALEKAIQIRSPENRIKGVLLHGRSIQSESVVNLCIKYQITMLLDSHELCSYINADDGKIYLRCAHFMKKYPMIKVLPGERNEIGENILFLIQRRKYISGTSKQIIRLRSNGYIAASINKPLHIQPNYYQYDFEPHDKNRNNSEFLFENGYKVFFPEDMSLVEQNSLLNKMVQNLNDKYLV